MRRVVVEILVFHGFHGKFREVPREVPRNPRKVSRVRQKSFANHEKSSADSKKSYGREMMLLLRLGNVAETSKETTTNKPNLVLVEKR